MNTKINSPTVLEVRRCDDPNCPKCLTARQDARIAELEAALADVVAAADFFATEAGYSQDERDELNPTGRFNAARALLAKGGR